jgi:acetate kinase
MGMTPLEGLVMGTRSGDLDPAIVNLIATKEGMSPSEVDAEANHAQDKKLQKQLERLFTRMETVLQSYADQDDRSID